MNRKKSLFNFLQQRIKNVLILTFAISSFAFVGSANAALLGLTLKQSPDINLFIQSSSYDDSSDIFIANGLALNYADGSPNGINIAGGTFALTAKIDINGMLSTTATDNIFNIFGDIDSGNGNELLLSGMLTAVGFDSAGNNDTLLEFEYAATSGALASAFSGSGGITLSDVGIDSDLFTKSFNSANFDGDVGIKVPEPLSVLLFGAGLLALGVKRRRS